MDGEGYDMVRPFWMETDRPQKVGLVMQPPLGEGGPRRFERLSIREKTIEHLRRGM